MSGDDTSSCSSSMSDSSYPDSDGDYRSSYYYPRYKSRYSMKDEQRHFFKKALKFLVEDAVKLLKRQILILREIETVDFNTETDFSRYLEALDIIKEQIVQTDVASAYYKLGGLVAFPTCLRCPHPDIRSSVLHIMGHLSEINESCKKAITSSELFPLILSIMDTEKDPTVCKEILFAINFIVKNNQEANNILLQLKGLDKMMKFLQMEDEKIQAKTAFLLANISRNNPEIKKEFVSNGYLPILVSLIPTEQLRPCHENLLELLVIVAKNNNPAIEQLKQPDFNMLQFILNCWQGSKGMPNGSEMEELCMDLLSILNLPEIT